jgi:hypothetical protein
VGWDGASEAQQRSKQATEELLAFLEAAAALSAAGLASPGKPPRPGAATGLSRQQQGGKLKEGGDAAAPAGMPPQWLYGMQLAGHCCAAGLLDAARAAEWAASSKVLLPLPAAGRRQVLAQCLPVAALSQQQVLALAELCLASAEAAAAAAAAGGWELQQGLLQAVAQLLELHPAAFVAADEQLLQPLVLLGEEVRGANSGSGPSSNARQCTEWVSAARKRLSRGLHARWV